MNEAEIRCLLVRLRVILEDLWKVFEGSYSDGHELLKASLDFETLGLILVAHFDCGFGLHFEYLLVFGCLKFLVNL